MSTTTSPVRIGIIGCGQIAQQHLETYATIPGANVVACADINPAAADGSAAKFGIPNVYYSAWEMLKRDDLDAIDVCLHNNLHVSGARAVLESGRHCYCEKPMAGTYRDALTMIETAKSLGLKLHIQLAMLYTEDTRAARELIEAGELGRIYHGRSMGFRRRGRPFVDGYGSQTFVQIANSGGGALYDMGVYHISQMLYLMGNPKATRITGKTYQELGMDEARKLEAGYSVEELGLGFVRFENNMSLDIIEAWAANLGGMESSCLLGTKGGVRLSPFGFFRSVGDLDLNATVDLSAARYRWNKLRGEGDLYANSQVHWIAALQGRCDLYPTAEIGLNTMLIQEGIYLSERRGEEVSAEEVASSSVSKALGL